MNDFIGYVQYKQGRAPEPEARRRKVRERRHDRGRANYRNHRKIVVIDGHIGYTGGIERRAGVHRRRQALPMWRDTHMRYTGQGVAELQKLFGVRWYEVTGERHPADKYLPRPRRPGEQGDILTQTVAQGVDDPWESAGARTWSAIANAKALACASSRPTSSPTRPT